MKDIQIIQAQRNGSTAAHEFFVATCIDNSLGRDIKLLVTFETTPNEGDRVDQNSVRAISPDELHLAWRGDVYGQELQRWISRQDGTPTFLDLVAEVSA